MCPEVFKGLFVCVKECKCVFWCVAHVCLQGRRGKEKRERDSQKGKVLKEGLNKEKKEEKN